MKWLICVAVFACSFASISAIQAQDYTIAEQNRWERYPIRVWALEPVYEVQVEYWFFDTTSYHWSTKLSTSDYALANSYYQALLIAKANGQLSSVVPNSYWRYIPVDVRMVTKYRLKLLEFN